ncbi:MAG: DUF624 domain-containing protein [Lachnospiraceae bacterium]|nr:DUF624 domain-containing protein [Lachnospiraceae bacterium]
MSNFFQQDNPLFRFMGRFFDLMHINLLFILTSIPLFTIGASLSASYSICLKIINNEEPSITKEYFKAFKLNFKQATIIWLSLLFGLCFFGYDLYIIYCVIDPKYLFIQVPVWIIIALLVSIFIYSFPQIGRFESTTKNIVKNSILISLSNLPVTIFYVVIHLILYYLTFVEYKNIIIAFSLVIFFGFAAIIYFFSIFFNRIFDKIQG